MTFEICEICKTQAENSIEFYPHDIVCSDCEMDMLHQISQSNGNSPYQTKIDSIIYPLKSKYDALNFYPSYYDSEWHVSIRDGAIEYRLYPYHKRQDCLDECRVLNKRHNV